MRTRREEHLAANWTFYFLVYLCRWDLEMCGGSLISAIKMVEVFIRFNWKTLLYTYIYFFRNISYHLFHCNVCLWNSCILSSKFKSIPQKTLSSYQPFDKFFIRVIQLRFHKHYLFSVGGSSRPIPGHRRLHNGRSAGPHIPGSWLCHYDHSLLAGHLLLHHHCLDALLLDCHPCQCPRSSMAILWSVLVN